MRGASCWCVVHSCWRRVCEARVLLRGCSATTGEPFLLVNAAKKKSMGASYTHSGTIRVASCAVIPRPSFLEFVTGGCELNFMVV